MAVRPSLSLGKLLRGEVWIHQSVPFQAPTGAPAVEGKGSVPVRTRTLTAASGVAAATPGLVLLPSTARHRYRRRRGDLREFRRRDADRRPRTRQLPGQLRSVGQYSLLFQLSGCPGPGTRTMVPLAGPGPISSPTPGPHSRVRRLGLPLCACPGGARSCAPLSLAHPYPGRPSARRPGRPLTRSALVHDRTPVVVQA